MALPPELWDHVLDLYAAECLLPLSSDSTIGRREQLMPFYDSMRSYALVCRDSSGAAQRLLFREIAILPTIIPGQYWGSVDDSPAQTLLRLDETLRSMHAKGSKAHSSVRILDLAAGYTPSHAYGSFSTVTQVVLRCPGVTELRLSVGDLEASHDLSPHDIEALGALSLRRLTVTGHCASPLSPEESEGRLEVPVSSLITAAAASLEYLSVTNIHGHAWAAINTAAFPRLTSARVLKCGPPAEQEVLTLRLPEHAPALHTLHVQPASYQWLVGSPSPLCKVRDIRVSVARGTFSIEHFRAPDRLVLQWSDPFARLGIAQLRALNASLRVVELALLDNLSTSDVHQALSYLAEACRELPRLALLLIHSGKREERGGIEEEISPLFLAGFSCAVRVETDSEARPFEEVMKIVDALELSTQSPA